MMVGALGCKKKPNDDDYDPTPPPRDASVPSVPTFDAEGLPTGNDLDSILVRLNYRYRQNDFFRYQIETDNLRLLKKQQPITRSAEVFQTSRTHAGTPAAQPHIATIPYVAWQQMLGWATKDETPVLCQMLRAERIEARQSDLFGKLAEFKDPRCAETIAPYLAAPARRGTAEQMLKTLDSSAEKFVWPYLRAGNDKDTRVAALQVVVEIGTVESAKIVETMTRDTDLWVNHFAKVAFEKLSKKYGTEQDLIAVVAALREGIVAQSPVAIHDNSDKLDKAYRADHPQRAEIFKRLVECCKVPDQKSYGKRAAYVGALKWSNADDIGVLCELLVTSGGESVVFLKLKEYKDQRCAETVAAFLATPLKSGEAADVLKVLGAGTERSVVPYTLRAYPNGAAVPFATRLAAIEVLGDIGTKESVPVLRQLAMDPMVQQAANKALTKVMNRPKDP
jgi:hypothetical protein